MPTPFPWLYPYQEDTPRRDSVVLRPIVRVTVIGTEPATPVFALVDSGCEHVLVAPWVAQEAGIDITSSHHEIDLGIGGETVITRFVDAQLRLFAPSGDDDDFVEWGTEIGLVDHWKPTWPIIVGEVGFMDKVTVTLSRHSQQCAIEEWNEFDERFG